MAIRQCKYPRQPQTNMQFKENGESKENNSFSPSLEGSASRPYLGLTLTKSPSFINLLESKLAETRKQQKRMDDFIAQSKAEKLKASNFPASLLIIGSWKRSTKNEGDLIAKLYFSKRKLVWEMLEVALKTKIEIQWSDISAIRAQFPDNDFDVLEIQLNQPPSFSRETNPQPRKHTIWEQSSDFTGGQAQICRKHTVYFPPGTLKRHYEKLLQCDQRLYNLSDKTFPSDENPYFHPNPYGNSDFPSNFNGCLPQFSHVQPNHLVQNLPILPAAAHLPNFKQDMNPHFSNMNPISPMSVTDLPVLDEGGNSYNENTNQSCNPGVNNQIHALDSIAEATMQENANQNYYLNYGDVLSARMNNPNNVFSDFESQLMENFPATYSNEMAFLTALDLQQAVANTIPDPPQSNCWLPHQQVSNNNMYVNSPVNTIPDHSQPNCWLPHQQVSNNNMYVHSSVNTTPDHSQPNHWLPNQPVSNNDMYVNSSVNTIPDHSQPNHWLPHQPVSNNDMYVNSLVNTSMYPYVGPTEATMEDFAALAARQSTHYRK